MTTKFFGSCGLALLLAAIGCGGTALPETVSVSGTVSYQSKPVEGAQVVLNSADPKCKPAAGTTDSQGRFSVKTYVDPTAQAKGAMPGNYKITVTKLEQTTLSSEEQMKASSGGKPAGPKHLLPEKYSSVENTDLTVEVKKGSTPALTLELKD